MIFRFLFLGGQVQSIYIVLFANIALASALLLYISGPVETTNWGVPLNPEEEDQQTSKQVVVTFLCESSDRVSANMFRFRNQCEPNK